MNNDTRHSSYHTVGRHPDRPVHPVASRQNEEPPAQPSGGFSSILSRCLLTTAITVAAGLVMATVAALAVAGSPDPTALIPVIAPCILGVLGILGGWTAGRLNPIRPVAAAAAAGGLLSVLLILLSLTFDGGTGVWSWLMRLGVIPLHFVGGLLSRPRPKAPAHQAGKHTLRR